MAKYYISNENSWQTQKNKQEKMGQGIDVLYDIDRWLDRAFSQLEYDKYGLMTRNSYSSRRTKIQQCDKKNSILYNYSKSIHGIVADKDFQFFKELNKAYEELSLLDIKEYTTKNTLNITEKKTIPISYYSGSMAYQSGTATSYETRDVLKGNINIYDIQMKCDMFHIEEQLKAYLDTSGEKLSDKEIKEAKENFYKEILNTSFEHEVYADDFFKGLSTTLDFIPVVGGVKNVIEGCTGYTMTGEKLRDSERATYAVLGTLSTTLDLVMFGTASGLIQSGKFVGKEVAKASIKQATKVAILETTGSVVMGWTSQFASEKLRDMGLSSEEIFVIHVLVGVSTVGVSKYQTRKLYDNWDDFKEVMYDVGKRTDLTDKQKVNKIKKLFKHVGDKTDINIPEHVRYLKGFSKEGVPIYDWPDNLGFDISTIQGISKENSLPLKWDRYGSLYGTNFATNSNPPYTYSERALPYVFNQDAYHSGKFVTETYFDKIDAIKNNDLNALNSILSIEDIPPVNSEYFERLQENFRNYKMSCNNLIDSDYGIFGKANAWDKLSGGADQIVTPLNGVQFERLGILINKR